MKVLEKNINFADDIENHKPSERISSELVNGYRRNTHLVHHFIEVGLGYNAPIEVYDQKYYRYADPNYSITELPLTAEDFNLITKAVKMLETTEDKLEFQQMGRILTRVKKRLTVILNYG